MSKNIYLDAPNIGEEEKCYLNKAVDSGFVSTLGPLVAKFEEKFAEYINTKTAVSTQSGTAALHIALYELGIGCGDEVIIPASTFVATINAVLYVGAVPVIVDVEPATWNINPVEIKKAVTPKTKAIVAVHLYGNPCNMNEIMTIADKHSLYVVEDATESLGAKYNGKHTGTIGDFGCFSFNGNKIITTGGGGMVVGEETEKLKHIKFLINQAKCTEKSNHSEMGFNFRMTNIEAALGLAQIEKLSRFLAKRKKINDIYRNNLKEISNVDFQKEYDKAENSYWLTGVTFPNDIDIPTLQKKLQKKAVPTRRVFVPLVEFPPYKKYKTSVCKHSYGLYKRGLCLPSSTLNSEEDINYVCKVLKEALS